MGLSFYRARYSNHREVRGLETEWPAGRKPRNCADAHYLAEIWPERAYQARVATEEWILEQKTLEEQDTWIAAIREVQAAYPDTYDWLASCSASEGAGRSLSINYFQMNHQGSGAGGWMQFMESTFWRHFGAAKTEVEARGFIVPESAARWDSRIGQALAGAWGGVNSRGEWSGSGC